MDETSVTVAVRGHAQTQLAPQYARLHVAVTAASEGSSTDVTNQVNDVAAAIRAHLLHHGQGVREVSLSRVRVDTQTNWVESGLDAALMTTRTARLTGVVEVEAANVDGVAAAIIDAGGSISYVSWGIDPEHAAYREVRRDAVHAARLAAEDFADAAGMQLGPLVSLADPGVTAAVARGAAPAGLAAAHAHVTLDPEDVTVAATVEAVYLLVP